VLSKNDTVHIIRLNIFSDKQYCVMPHALVLCKF